MRYGPALPTGMEGLINPVPFFEPDDFVRIGIMAEELGYDSVWGNDHYAPQDYVAERFGDPPNFYEVLTVLSLIAAETSRVELGTAVLVLPMRDIVTVAKQVSTLDQLSGGRLLLGVGIGAYKEEYAAARPDLAGFNRGEMLDEGLDLLGRLLRDDHVDFEGRFYRTKQLRLFPKPKSQPFRLLVGGHNTKAITRAVTHGQGWIPGWRPLDELRDWIGILRRRAEEAGRDPASLIVAPQLACLVDPSHERAESRYLESGMVRHRQSLAYTGRDPDLAMRNNLVGSPSSVIEKVMYLHEAGVDHLAAITFCVDTVDEYVEQLRLFAAEVMEPCRREMGPA